MAINKKIMGEICKQIGQRSAYRKISKIRRKTGNSISKNIAACILASQINIDVYNILQNDDKELAEFRQALTNFDDAKIIKQPKKEDNKKNTKKDSPYDYSLSKFDLDGDLIKNCKIQLPYRTAVKEAALVLETRIRTELQLGPEYTGTRLIQHAKKINIFKRPIDSEADGLYFTYMGVFQWIRNPPGHQQIEYTKDETIKIILYIDYLIKLFSKIANANA